MLGIIRGWSPRRALVSFLMAAVLVLGLASCGDRAVSLQTPGGDRVSQNQLTGPISEVAPPEIIQQLRPALEGYQPQVKIVSPQRDEILQEPTVGVKLQVQDLPIFKNSELGMGPHLHVILDNQPYIPVYDLDKPLILEDLSPGTHTLRVFASRPWHESFKNEGAYAQTTFHIFTKNTDNDPNPTQPLLTYSRPKDKYGAEPIMLDFYLTNAPLHLAAQENPNDEIADWRIRVTVNGQSFVLDKWQPIYLKGFNSGKNWVHLEFLDELGNPIKNVFNDTVRLITYEPKGQDKFSKLVRGEISAEVARGIVDPNYTSQKPAATATPTPNVEKTPIPEPATPEVEPSQPAEPLPTEANQTEKPKSDNFFNRFRRPEASPSPTLPKILETPTPEVAEPSTSLPVPQTPEPEASATPNPEVAPIPSSEPLPAEPEKATKSKYGSGNYFSRFRRPTPSPSLPATLPEIVETPTPEPDNLVTPNALTDAEEEPAPSAEEVPELHNAKLATP
ncbi:MAG TPA: hypothetical protein V6D12_02355 [Candidatus Obscuribacterales bacterium]